METGDTIMQFKLNMIIILFIVFLLISSTPVNKIVNASTTHTMIANNNNQMDTDKKLYQEYIVRFIDSQTGSPISSASVFFEKNGRIVIGKSNINGYVIVEDFPFTEEDDRKGRIKYRILAEGYYGLQDKSPCFQREISLCKRLIHNTYRIVLQWGKIPWDLDAHLSFGERQQVYWENRKVNNIEMDRDDKYFYGPETITVYKTEQDMKYCFFVHNYSHYAKHEHQEANNTYDLSQSDARVYIYSVTKGIEDSNHLIKTYHIPKNEPGIVWQVFSIQNNEIVDKNKIVTRYQIGW